MEGVRHGAWEVLRHVPMPVRMPRQPDNLLLSLRGVVVEQSLPLRGQLPQQPELLLHLRDLALARPRSSRLRLRTLRTRTHFRFWKTDFRRFLETPRLTVTQLTGAHRHYVL